MRTKLLLMLLLFQITAIGQEKKKKETVEGNIDTLKIALTTDINFSSSSNDSRKEASAGIGTLGLKFSRGYVYGDINFTVYSQNKDAVVDSTDTKIFGTNLLLPQNSSAKISNFFMLVGIKTFFLKTGYPNDEPTFSLKRFGANAAFRVNNNVWKKDSLSSSVTINSFDFNITYTLINAKVFSSNEDIKVILSYGVTTRRIGGDMALKSNDGLRRSFLNTDRLGFNGTNLGCRLEISKFYGQMNLTSFTKKDDIAGFSGNQAIITLGLRADLTLNAKERDLKESRLKKLEEKVDELEGAAKK